jgi:ATP-dependent RNA helicase RhlE
LVEHSVYHVDQQHKPQLLVHYLQKAAGTRTIVFARTKHGADKIVKHLDKSGIRAAAIHGNKSQSVRQRTLAAFKSKRPPVLVATDIAARGIDVQGVSHVINFELPEVPEVYVHRIGRTGRAGATGVATSFCARHERDQLRLIERLIRKTLAMQEDHPEFMRVPKPHDEPAERSGSKTRGRHGNWNPPRGKKPKSRRPKQGVAYAAVGAQSGNGNGKQRRRRNRTRHTTAV